jgi:hypothetical protein
MTTGHQRPSRPTPELSDPLQAFRDRVVVASHQLDALLLTQDAEELDSIVAGNEATIRSVFDRERDELANYLGSVHSFLLRYVAFPSEHEPVAIALWIAHAWQIEQFETAPFWRSRQLRCGVGKRASSNCSSC